MPETVSTAEAAVDLARADRCGFPEVVYGPGKSAAAVVEIFAVQQQHGQACLATRVDELQTAAVRERFPAAIVNAIARTVRLPAPAQPAPEQLGDTAQQDDTAQPTAGRVAVLTAGTTDRPVAEEAAETLRWMGVTVEVIVDVGVAGPQRLLEARPRFVGADAVVVCAGMEGALPSIVGGHVACPVFAVPTSVGYGAAFGGIAALLGMLNSCAANVAVVNIDAGFKAGYLAGLVARRTNSAIT